MIPTPEQAWELLCEYNEGDFHRKHGRIVGDVLRWYANELGYGDEADFWQAVGILHDLDFEQWPEEHCKKADSLLRELDVEESVIHAVVSHGWGVCSEVEPERYMEKILFATDELTGLIWAASLMRPTGFEGMDAKSVMKKFKDKKFAAGCSRDIISRGAELLGMTMPELAALTLEAMTA